MPVWCLPSVATCPNPWFFLEASVRSEPRPGQNDGGQRGRGPVSGTYDTRWDNGVLNPAFGSLTANDFEVVQLGWAPSVSLVVTLPAVMGAGDAADGSVTAYDSSYALATGYRGTIHFTCSDGAATLPVNYTFTAGDSGTHAFPGGFTLRTAGGQTVTATDIADGTITGSRNVVVGPETPAGLTAAATTPTNINLSWNASPSAAQYEIVCASASSSYSTLIVTAMTNYSDSSVAAGATYVYKVRAIDAFSRLSPFSAPDAATTIFFTDDPLIATATVMKAVHITELRQAANVMRAAAGLGAASFADPVLTGVSVRAIHLQQLRTALTEARAALGLSAVSYTDATLVPGATVVKAAHVQELRGAVK